mmetsp:Transcript_102034/g.233698  ORF Transcript_102034/g.233698 Transcript_102034/m.233698 type:complete len:202 (-) Transcript_102034:1353-1958(-)
MPQQSNKISQAPLCTAPWTLVLDLEQGADGVVASALAWHCDSALRTTIGDGANRQNAEAVVVDSTAGPDRPQHGRLQGVGLEDHHRRIVVVPPVNNQAGCEVLRGARVLHVLREVILQLVRDLGKPTEQGDGIEQRIRETRGLGFFGLWLLRGGVLLLRGLEILRGDVLELTEVKCSPTYDITNGHLGWRRLILRLGRLLC